MQNAPIQLPAQLNSSPSNTPANPKNILIASVLPPPNPAAPSQVPGSVSQSSSAPSIQNAAAPSGPASSPQLPENSTAPASNSQTLSPTSSNAASAKAVQTAHADLSFLNLLAPNLTTAAAASAKFPVPAPPNPATNPEAQLNLQSSAGAAQSLPATLEHDAAKSAAIGASTFKLHGDPQPQPVSSASPASPSALADKAQSQDSSNGSSSNDSNPKPDHAPAAAGAHTDEKGFVQTLDTAAVNPMSGHSQAADSATAAAAAAAPPANSPPQTPAPSNSESQTAPSLPDASQNQAVVSAAHMLQQPGQTEIRIEMQADSLGGVELRAHIAGDQIGASIAVEHHDAQMALTSDLPALHNALAEKNLRVETLTVSQGTFSSLSGGAGQDGGQRGFPQNPAKFAYLEQPQEPPAAAESPADWTGPGNPRTGLSVVA
jgi:flagellar hook-length control protein FliK